MSIELAHFYVSRISFWPSRQCITLFSFRFRGGYTIFVLYNGAKFGFRTKNVQLLFSFYFLLPTMYDRDASYSMSSSLVFLVYELDMGGRGHLDFVCISRYEFFRVCVYVVCLES